MRKYYMVPGSDFGRHPQINLNRHDCDTFFITQDGKFLRGWVYCRFGGNSHPYPNVEVFMERYANEEYEITKEVYEEMRRYF